MCQLLANKGAELSRTIAECLRESRTLLQCLDCLVNPAPRLYLQKGEAASQLASLFSSKVSRYTKFAKLATHDDPECIQELVQMRKYATTADMLVHDHYDELIAINKVLNVEVEPAVSTLGQLDDICDALRELPRLRQVLRPTATDEWLSHCYALVEEVANDAMKQRIGNMTDAADHTESVTRLDHVMKLYEALDSVGAPAALPAEKRSDFRQTRWETDTCVTDRGFSPPQAGCHAYVHISDTDFDEGVGSCWQISTGYCCRRC